MHPWVVKDGDVYYMWYSAHNGTDPQRLGMAKSEDGITWVKSPGNPIILDANNGFGEPSVIKDGNIWRMWAIADPSSYYEYDMVYYEATGPFEFQSIQAAIDLQRGRYGSGGGGDVYREICRLIRLSIC